jgi:iron complex transport system substrate-binding protein
MPAHRVITLIASATETVAALGFGDRLVGRSHECDYPPGIERLPVCSSSRIRVDANSLDIDRQVKSVLHDGLSVYRVNTDRLEELQPDLIITQTQCEVCAVSLKDVEQAVCEVVGSHPKILSTEAEELAGIWRDIERVAEALGEPRRGREFTAERQQRLCDLRQQTACLPMRPTVACIEWIDPLMAAGNWVPELVEVIGGINLFGEAGKHSPWMTWTQLQDSDPDVIAIMPCGFDSPRCRREMSALTSHPEWPALRAVREGRVFLTDGNQYFNRPGPRMVESAEILAEICYPGVFDFGHQGTGWERL